VKGGVVAIGLFILAGLLVASVTVLTALHDTVPAVLPEALVGVLTGGFGIAVSPLVTPSAPVASTRMTLTAPQAKTDPQG
jgi:hypothetical protein